MTTPNSFSGKAQATYLVSDITDPAATSFTVVSASTWTETVPVGGSNVGSALGTSGNFVLTLDYGLPTEEKVLCSAVNTSTGAVTVATRGYDGTTARTHVASASNPVIHTYSADVPSQANIGVTNAAAAQATANTGVANAATAQSTANTALTNAYGVNLTSRTPWVGTNPSSPAVLKQYTFTTTVTPSGSGTASITFPTAFVNSLQGATASMCYTGAYPGAYVVMDGTATLSSITLYFFATPIYQAGTPPTVVPKLITSGTYRVNVTVCGY